MTDVGALPDDWVTDTALLARVLTRLRQWGEPAGPVPLAQPRHAVGHPEFGVTRRRASPTDPPIDITMPRSPDRSPVACPPPLFRRPVGSTTPTSESGS
ncbi:MAG: hypothetical protein WAL99_01435 [Pseudonocardiaceae bacterium]